MEENKEEKSSEQKASSTKRTKFSLEEFAQQKLKRREARLKTAIPWFLKLILSVPLVIVIGLLLVYIFYVKNLAIR